jgi:site-specific recombinase XerD
MREYSVIPTFRGPLAVYLTKFLAEKHALGIRYRTQAKILRMLDRVMQEAGLTDAALPRSFVEAWIAKRAHEQPATHTDRVSLTREVARYLQRMGIDAYVPAALIGQRRGATYQPYIFTATEVQALLTVVEHLPVHAATPYRHAVVPVIFQLLYGCGLRLGEVLPLRWRAVDLARGLLVLRDAKGHQDRLVPCLDALARNAFCHDSPWWASPRCACPGVPSCR